MLDIVLYCVYILLFCFIIWFFWEHLSNIILSVCLFMHHASGLFFSVLNIEHFCCYLFTTLYFHFRDYNLHLQKFDVGFFKSSIFLLNFLEMIFRNKTCLYDFHSANSYCCMSFKSVLSDFFLFHCVFLLHCMIEC
jgi:hypothetical protein